MSASAPRKGGSLRSGRHRNDLVQRRKSSTQVVVRGHKRPARSGRWALPAAAVYANVTCVYPEASDGDLLWTPSPDTVARANATVFIDWLAREQGLRFSV